MARTLCDCGPSGRMSPPTLALDCEIASVDLCRVTSYCLINWVSSRTWYCLTVPP